MLAIVQIGSSQYVVRPDDIIQVDFLGKNKSQVVFDQVLLVADGEQLLVGKPFVTPPMVVNAQVIDHPQGEKIRVGKFKAKSRYHKFIGFRAKYTRLKITDVVSQKQEINPKEEVKIAAAPRVRRTKVPVKANH